MEEPAARIKELQRIKDVACKLLLSRKDSRYKYPTTPRAFVAERLYPKLILHLESLLTLVHKRGRTDFSALASISRMIIEHHNVYHYLCGSAVTNDMFEFRYLLYDFHSSHETSRILSRLGFGDDENDHFGFFGGIKEWQEDRLNNDPYYLSLNQKDKKRILTGKSAFFFCDKDKKYEVIPAELESGIYKLFSNSVHTYGLGIDMVYGGADYRHINTNSLLFLVIESCIIFASSMINSYCKMRWKLAKNISGIDRGFIKEMTKTHNIGEWIEFRKIYRESQKQ